MKRQHKRLRDYCPFPETPLQKLLRQYSKPFFSTVAVSIIAVSLLAASTLLVHPTITPVPVSPSSATPTPSATDAPASQPTQKPTAPSSTTSTSNPIPATTPSPTSAPISFIPSYIANGTDFGQLLPIYVQSMIKTSDGGFVVVGQENSCAMLAKLDSSGSLEWKKNYGGSGGYCVIQTSDGGYAFGGYSQFAGGSAIQSAYFAKVDADGNLQFNMTTSFGTVNLVEDIIQTSDGGYSMAVVHGSPRFAASTKIWQIDAACTGEAGYFGVPISGVKKIYQTDDGGFIAAGTMEPSYPSNLTLTYGKLAKLSGNGTVEWTKIYGNETDVVRDLVKTSDGGYAIAVKTSAYGAGLDDFLLIKTDQNGNMQWNQTYGTQNNEDPFRLICTSDGGYALIGSTQTDSRSDDIFIVKTDANGHQMWNASYGGNKSDLGFSVWELQNGGYAILGTTKSFNFPPSYCWLIFTDATGKPVETPLAGL